MLLQKAGGEAAKQIVTKIFAGPAKDFETVITRAVAKLDKQYDKELFGGNLREFLLKPEVTSLLKRFLDPFDQPTDGDFKKLSAIDFKTLPTNFLDRLKFTLLDELSRDIHFHKQMREVLHMLQTDTISLTVESLSTRQDEVLEKVNVVLGHLLALKRPNISLPIYPLPDDYIPRRLFPLSSASDPYAEPKGHLRDIIDEERLVIVCSAAGMGKSTDVAYLASQLSKEGSHFVPILCKINTYSGQEIGALLEQQLKGWDQLESEMLVLIFDGLDEVNEQFFEIFLAKIFDLQRQMESFRIVITCRDNFLNPMLLSQTQRLFALYKLKPLSDWDVIIHARQKFGNDRADRFLSQARSLGISEIMRSPFFMSFLFGVEERSEPLPASKQQIFERLLDYRIEKDKERFSLTGAKIDKHIVYIKKQIGRLALIMETAGRNYITDDEFQELIPEYEKGRELLEHTVLFNKESKNLWQFDHNNFQEYLAAKAISTKTFEQIRSLVALPPTYSELKPTWVNTLSFVFILLDQDGETFQKLLHWMVQTDAELLLRFERDRIELSRRQMIFFQILNSYRAKGIVARSQNFDITDLADFVSDSTDILLSLKEHLKPESTHLVIGETVRMLPRFEAVQSLRSEFQPLLEELVVSGQVSPESKYYIVSCLSELDWRRADFVLPMLLSTSKDDQYGRAAIFQYLADSGFQNEFVETILETAKLSNTQKAYINHTPSRKSVTLGDESILREKCVLSISSPAAFAKVLAYLTELSNQHSSSSLINGSLIDGLLKKISLVVSEGETFLLEPVIELFTSKAIYRHRPELESFVAFFKRTSTRQKALN